ncbi:ABC transporter permease [Candidatus Mycoplasma haematominutum]|uniref:Polyamine (Spermidine/putrescine) ABC transporter permease protein PotC n=1 Tax=Candidatus Mycoplasma haematominutum 'Birmingham 1' TaxID=1116213 RepID=G8C2L6_9MOLU|nr:ABC transporter permease subunit [Candidatus Mycoplasma haematominutum]CCE66564.1 polyamine (spermidine/putrescine) ABC transporter permease protein PotC [Candidatus Mycoplasma haematominutum 'Birmingham 1']
MFYGLSFYIQDSSRWSDWFRKMSIFFFFLILYFPWVIIVFLSFNTPNEKGIVSTNLQNSASSFTFKNYSTFFSLSPGDNDSFWTSLLNSLFIGLSALFPSLWISLLSSFAIWKRGGKLRKTVFRLSNLSISSPELIQGISFMLLFSAVFLPLGLDFGFLTLVLTHIAFLVPYGIILIYPKFEKLDRRLLLACHDLNYSNLEALMKVLAPQLKGTLIFSSLVMMILSMDDFIISNLVKGRITTLTTQFYTMKKGIKGWALTFGSLLFLLSILTFLSVSAFNKCQPKSKLSFLKFPQWL